MGTLYEEAICSIACEEKLYSTKQRIGAVTFGRNIPLGCPSSIADVCTGQFEVFVRLQHKSAINSMISQPNDSGEHS